LLPKKQGRGNYEGEIKMSKNQKPKTNIKIQNPKFFLPNLSFLAISNINKTQSISCRRINKNKINMGLMLSWRMKKIGVTL